jgi:hypothetical protein
MISVALVVVILAIIVPHDVFTITTIILGSAFGTFVLDSEYFLYAYVFEPQADFSKTLAAFVKHGDLLNAVRYIQFHKNEIKEKSLNSAVFQIAMALTCIFVSAANTGFFIKALVLSIFLNSIYVMFENYFQQHSDDWFWALKTKPNKRAFIIYTVILLGVFAFCLNLL